MNRREIGRGQIAWRQVGRWLFVALFLGRLPSGLAQDPRAKFIAQTPPRTPAEQAELFHLPPGFRIELVASEPETVKPINLNFDAAGRLYVTQSVEYPFPPPPDRPGRDTIKLLRDVDGDGVPRKVSTFADGLSIPIGVTPVPDGVLGYSVPNIYRFEDTDGDLQSDRREVAYERFGFADTHGMASSFTWWIDGWVYACHGFSNRSTVRGADGEAVTMHSGNTYRVRPDGSHIEQFTYGQVNPFGMTFDPLGNVYSADCHTKPISMLLRGGHYPSFGRPHDGLGFAPPMMGHLHGSTGIASVAYYAAHQFPAEYRETIFVGNPITGCVNHDRLQARGSTYQAIEQPDFLTCDDPWFRPVDLQIAPDGTLYIADFYNRIIGHYEVPLNHPQRDRTRGRIWRIVYVGTDDKPADAPAPPVDLTRATAVELVEQLASLNLTVRTQATHQLVHRIGKPAVARIKELLDSDATAAQRAHGVWVLARLGALDRQVIDRLAADDERMVRVHLVKALAEQPAWNAHQRSVVRAKLGDPDAFVRRAAADALGRHPHADGIPELLSLWDRTDAEDTHLLHTVRMALRDTIERLGNINDVARDYRDSPETLNRLAGLGLGIHSPESSAFLLDYYNEHPIPAGRRAALLRHTGRYLDPARLPEFYERTTDYRDEGNGVQLEVIRALQQAAQERGRALPASVTEWAVSLASSLLSAKDEGAVRAGVGLARDLRLKETEAQLLQLAGPETRHPGLRPAAWDALAVIAPQRAGDLLSGVVADLALPVGVRQRAAEVLGRLNTVQGRRTLVEQLKFAPRNLALTIARSLSPSREGAEALLAAAEKGQASPRLLQDLGVNARLHSAGVDNLRTRVDKLLDGLPPVDEEMLELMQSRRTGFQAAETDPTRGRALFKKNCAACHQVGGEGAKVGPELDGVGLRGLDRLLEDVLNPNRNVDANFRSSVLALSDGRVLNGLVLRRDGEVLVVVDDKGKENRVPVAEIEERRQLKLSPMPANVVETLKEQDFYDLIAFLLAQQRPAKTTVE